jgi:hypothetical protein
MRCFFDQIARVFGWLDAVEFAVPAIAAALFLVVGPLLASVYFFRTQHYAAAVIIISLWMLAPIACIRDLYRRHFGWMSVSLSVVWFITTLILWWRLVTL